MLDATFVTHLRRHAKRGARGMSRRSGAESRCLQRRSWGKRLLRRLLRSRLGEIGEMNLARHGALGGGSASTSARNFASVRSARVNAASSGIQRS